MPDPQTQSSPPPKRSRFAWSAAVWASVGGLLAFRTFYHPHRAVVERGFVGRCPGEPSCNPSLGIQPEGGSTTVFAVTSGRVVVTGQGVTLVSDREPIVVSYGSNLGQMLVESGRDVGIGTPIAVMRSVDFSVTEILRSDTGAVTFRPLEPASWLAARGLRITAKGKTAGTLWCTGGRTIILPAAVARCGIRLPAPASALLLPVSVTME